MEHHFSKQKELIHTKVKRNEVWALPIWLPFQNVRVMEFERFPVQQFEHTNAVYEYEHFHLKKIEHFPEQEFEQSPSLDLRKPSRGGEAGDSVEYSCAL